MAVLEALADLVHQISLIEFGSQVRRLSLKRARIGEDLAFRNTALEEGSDQNSLDSRVVCAIRSDLPPTTPKSSPV